MPESTSFARTTLRSKGVVRVEVQALPGSYPQGESVEETIGNASEAVAMYLEALGREGQDAPEDADVVHEVSVTLSPCERLCLGQDNDRR